MEVKDEAAGYIFPGLGPHLCQLHDKFPDFRAGKLAAIVYAD